MYTFIANERRYIRIMNKVTVACISVILKSIVSSVSYYGLLKREPFSYSVVWVGIGPKPFLIVPAFGLSILDCSFSFLLRFIVVIFIENYHAM